MAMAMANAIQCNAMARKVLDCLHRYIWDVVIFDSYSFLYSLFAFTHEIQARLHSTFIHTLHITHTAQKRSTLCWKRFFMRNNDDKTFSLLWCWFSLLFNLFISHKSIKCVQLFYWISILFASFFFAFFRNRQNRFNVLPLFFVFIVNFPFFSLPQQVIHPDRSDRWTLQIKFPQLRDSGVYGKKKRTFFEIFHFVWKHFSTW